MGAEWAEFFSKLLDVSPVLAIVVGLSIAYYFVYRVSINSHKELVNQLLVQLREDQKIFMDSLSSVYSRHA